MDYFKDLSIDENNLDQEWIKQATTLMRYQEELVKMEMVRDKLKEKIDIREAEIDHDIRLGTYEDMPGKVTEGAIKSSVVLDKEIRAHKEEYFKYVESAKILNGATKAFDHKKRALEKLVDLFITGYFSEPKTSSENIKNKILDNVQQQARKGLRK